MEDKESVLHHSGRRGSFCPPDELPQGEIYDEYRLMSRSIFDFRPDGIAYQLLSPEDYAKKRASANTTKTNPSGRYAAGFGEVRMRFWNLMKSKHCQIYGNACFCYIFLIFFSA